MDQSIIAHFVCWLALGEDGPVIYSISCMLASWKKKPVCWLAVGENGLVNYSTPCMMASCKGGWASQL